MAMPIGNINLKFNPNAGKGIVERCVQIEEFSCREDFQHQELVIATSQPSVPLDATLSSHPDGWSECLIPIFVKRHIASIQGFPASVPRHSTPVHSIHASPIGGVGMFATCSLKAGELILAERAMMITPRHFYYKKRPQVMYLVAEKQLEVLYNRMVPENQKAFMALYNSHENDGSGPLLGRCRTNCYGVTFGVSGRDQLYGGVFKQLSRINHSCGPNTGRVFDVKSFSMKLYAQRDIKEGEELTTAYCSLLSTTAQRRKALELYGFTCCCPHCIDPESDARRLHIVNNFDTSTLTSKLKEWGKNPSLPNNYLIKEAKDALAFIEKEGGENLEQYSTTLMHLCAIYNCIGTDAAMVHYNHYKEKLLRTWIGAGAPLLATIRGFKAAIVPLYRSRDLAKLEVTNLDGLVAGMRARGMSVKVINLT